MGVGRTWLAGLLTLIVAGLIWLFSEAPSGRPLPDDTPSDSSPSESRELGPAGAERRTPESTADDQGARREVEGAAVEADFAIFRGRCVDVDGHPLAGVKASVHAWVCNDERLNAYLKNHDEVIWDDPEDQVTAADGRFEFRFVPPPPYQFVLDLEADGLVGVGGRWGIIEPGTVKDFGDLTLLPGARVSGRLVDPEGRPVPKPLGKRLRLSINRYNRSDQPQGEIVPEDSVTADVNEDGSFVMRKVAAIGGWNVSLNGLLFEKPDPEVAIQAPETVFDVVVLRPESLLRLAGVVVDEEGQPIRSAEIDPVHVERANNWILYTDPQGRFEFEQRPDAVDPEKPFQLDVEKPGFRRLRTEELRWGQADVRIVMQRAGVMEVLVVRAADDQPVESYGLRVMNRTGMRSSSERDVIGGWKHEDGITRVTRMQRGGEKWILVEPRAEGLAAASLFVDVDLESPPALTVRLPALRSQAVRLVNGDGQPVAGTQVELIEPHREVRASSWATEFGTGRWSSSTDGYLVSRAETDADGRCVVQGPEGVPLTLRCVGEHPALIRGGVTLSDRELELTVQSGGNVTVRIEPAGVAAAWWRGLDEEDERARYRLPSVSLYSSVDGKHRSIPGSGDGYRIGRDGVAVLRGIPAGVWQVNCRWHVGGSNQFLTAPEEVRVEEGGDVELVIDASGYLTGSVAGTVRCGGMNPARSTLMVRRLAPLATPTGETRHENYSMQIAADGTFRGELPAGRYEAAIQSQLDGKRGPWVRARAAPDFTVRVGSEAAVELSSNFVTGTFRFLDSQGAPVPDLSVWCVDSGWPRPTMRWLNGALTLTGGVGSYSFACRIRSLTKREEYRAAYAEAREEHGGDHAAAQRAMEATVVRLPTPLTLAVGATSTEPIDVQLPAEWDR